MIFNFPDVSNKDWLWGRLKPHVRILLQVFHITLTAMTTIHIVNSSH